MPDLFTQLTEIGVPLDLIGPVMKLIREREEPLTRQRELTRQRVAKCRGNVTRNATVTLQTQNEKPNKINGHVTLPVTPLARVEDNLLLKEISGVKNKKYISSSKRDEIETEFEERFWPAYPKKAGKKEALKAYRSARKIATCEAIMFGVEKYAQERAGREAEYTKYAQGWLTGCRWENYSPPKPASEMAKEFVPANWSHGVRLLSARYRSETMGKYPQPVVRDGIEGFEFPAEWVERVKSAEKEMH